MPKMFGNVGFEWIFQRLQFKRLTKVVLFHLCTDFTKSKINLFANKYVAGFLLKNTTVINFSFFIKCIVYQSVLYAH